MKSPALKKSNLKRPWLVATVLIGGMMLYFFAVFLPTRRAMAALRLESEQQRAFVLQHGGAGAKIALAEQELATTRQFIDQWHLAAPQEARLSLLFGDLTRHADGAGVQIVRFEPQQALRMNVLDRIPVEMACEGSFDQIFELIKRLEALPVDFWITSLRIEPVTAGSPRLRCELTLAFFAGRREISD
jgi:Tfp pilus assembly protein PilO